MSDSLRVAGFLDEGGTEKTTTVAQTRRAMG